MGTRYIELTIELGKSGLTVGAWQICYSQIQGELPLQFQRLLLLDLAQLQSP